VCKVTKVQVIGYYSVVKVNTKINVATLLTRRVRDEL